MRQADYRHLWQRLAYWWQLPYLCFKTSFDRTHVYVSPSPFAGTSTTFLIMLLFSCSVVSDSLWPHGLQHTRLPCLPLSPSVCSNSCPLSRWCYPTVRFFVLPFPSCLQSFSASGSFPMSRLFASGGQSIAASASASVFPMNIQRWFPLWLTSFISRSKGLLRIFLSTTIQKHQFFGPQPSLWSHSHIRTWLLEKP